jgi:hypothetical protein
VKFQGEIQETDYMTNSPDPQPKDKQATQLPHSEPNLKVMVAYAEVKKERDKLFKRLANA